jgi:hypothetical protein
MGEAALINDWQEIKKLPAICLDISHSLKAKENVVEIAKTVENIQQIHVSFFDGRRTHQNILHSKKLLRDILINLKNVDWCLELSPEAFGNWDDDKIINELIQTRKFLENIN